MTIHLTDIAAPASSVTKLEEYALYLARARDVVDPTRYSDAAPLVAYEEFRRIEAFLEVIVWREGTLGASLAGLAQDIIEAANDISTRPEQIGALLQVLSGRLAEDADLGAPS